MRRSRPALLALSVTLACGGGGESGGVSNPPPPQPVLVGPPSVVRIQSGSDQQGEPGQKLAARPAVTVRDASDRPVPNIAVTFAVDSGGGTIAAAAQTTDASGVATAGEWTLGNGEGRQTLLASVGSLSPARFAAIAVYAPVVVGSRAVGATGGTLTVDRVGSPVHGLQVQVPDSAFEQSATIALGIRSSAGVVLADPASAALRSRAASSATSATSATGAAAAAAAAAAVPALLPLLTLQVTGPQWANTPVSVVIPLAAGVSPNVMVAVLDSANRLLTFLPIEASSPTSVTVSTRAFDWHVYAAVGTPPVTGTATTFTLTLAVFPVPRAGGTTQLNQVIPAPYQYPFLMSTHTFGFRDAPTAIANRIDAGMVLAAHGARWIYPGGITGTNQRATGAPLSDTRGLMLSAGLAKDFLNWIGPLPAKIAARHAQSPATYAYAMALSLYYTLVQTGYPVPLLLTDGVNTRMVLVVEWNSAGSYFSVYDPGILGFMRVGWAGTGIIPYPDPYYPTIQYTIPYTHPDVVSGMWPRVYPGLAQLGAPRSQPEPYRSAWPVSAISSWDPIVRGAPRWQLADSLFIVGDTTRLWYSMAGAKFGYPTALPLPAGHSLQRASVVVWDRPGNRWLPNVSLDGPSTYLDTRVAGQGGQPYEAQFGINLLQLEQLGLNSWLYFDRVDVVKYALRVANVSDTARAPVTMAVTSAGGPALPADAVYEWNFNDQTPLVRVTGPGAVVHTFANNGTYPVDLKVFHAKNPTLVIAKVRATATIALPIERWAFTSFTKGALTSTLPAGVFRPLSYWEDSLSLTDNTLRDSLLARAGGGTLELYSGTRPVAWRHPLEITPPNSTPRTLVLLPAAGAVAMYVTFPRGAQLMASPFAATGNAILAPSQGLPIYSQPVFANSLVRTPLVRYLGRAATTAYPIQVNLGPPSWVTTYLEIDATATPTGLSGTITFVVDPLCGGLPLTQCPANGLLVSQGQVRRVFHFTAVPS